MNLRFEEYPTFKKYLVLATVPVFVLAVFWRLKAIPQQTIGGYPQQVVKELSSPSFDADVLANPTITFDAKGVRITLYGGEIGKQYNPLVISKFASYLYGRFYKAGWLDARAQVSFLKQVDWLINNQGKRSGAWPYQFDTHGLKTPWVSASTQGAAMQALVSAYKVTKEAKYLDFAKKALKPFELGVYEGGVVDYIDGLPVYEEYPNSKERMHVFSGFVSSLFGLHDLYRVTKDPLVLEKFSLGVNTLKNRLYLWETEGGSVFSLGGNRSLRYHQRRATQLMRLYGRTGDKFFQEKAEEWSLVSTQ